MNEPVKEIWAARNNFREIDPMWGIDTRVSYFTEEPKRSETENGITYYSPPSSSIAIGGCTESDAERTGLSPGQTAKYVLVTDDDEKDAGW